MKSLRNYVGKGLGIVGILGASLLPMKDVKGQMDFLAYANSNSAEKIKSELEGAKLDSIEFAVSEFRDIFGKPASFIQKCYFSNNSILEISASDICKELKTRSVIYSNKGTGEKKILLFYTGNGGEELPKEDRKSMEKYVKKFYKGAKHVPGGVTFVGKWFN